MYIRSCAKEPQNACSPTALIDCNSEGKGHQDGPKGPRHNEYGKGEAKEIDYKPIPIPEPVYSKPEPIYTKPELVYTKPPKSKEYPKPTTTFTCPTTCRLDFHGTFLEYPTVIVYSSVYAQTVNALITELSDGSPGQSVEETITAPPGPAEAPLTWTAFGVELSVLAPSWYKHEIY